MQQDAAECLTSGTPLHLSRLHTVTAFEPVILCQKQLNCTNLSIFTSHRWTMSPFSCSMQCSPIVEGNVAAVDQPPISQSQNYVFFESFTSSNPQFLVCLQLLRIISVGTSKEITGKSKDSVMLKKKQIGKTHNHAYGHT